MTGGKYSVAKETEMMRRRDVIGAFALGAGLAQSGLLCAQQFPAKPIRFINPYAAGSNADTSARLVMDKASAALGQPFVMESKTGAGGAIAMAALARSPNDGYTIGLSTVSTMVTVPINTKDLTFDPDADFDPITLICNVPLVIVVPANSPFKTLSELLSYCRVNPGKLSYASDGMGSTTHLAWELLAQAAGANALAVPYRGGTAAYTVDLVAGRLDFAFSGLGVPLSLSRAKQVRLLAVGTKVRQPIIADVPTIAELGFAGYEASSWTGIYAPKGTPADRLQRLGDEIRRAVQDPTVNSRLIDAGFEPVTSTSAELRAFMSREKSKWTAVADKAGVKKV